MIKAIGLTKTFHDVEAVKQLTFEVPRGKIFGLIGPNGAGKTTTARLLAGILKPSAGEAWVANLSVSKSMREIRKLIGVVPEGTPLYRRLTAFETIRFFGQIHRVETAALDDRIAELAQRLDLSEHLRRPNEGLSLGTKKKVLFASALLHEPEVLLCDEPTLGLDPRATLSIIEILSGLKRDGKTVLLTSHNMEMVDQICDGIAVIHKGRICIQGRPNEIKRDLAALVAKKEVVLHDVFLHYTA